MMASRCDTDGVPADLNPSQRELLARLGAPVEARPRFDAGLGHLLRAELEDGVAEAAAAIDPADPLHVSKHALAGVHGCEARWQAESQRPFEPSVPVVRGAVAHKAIEYSVHWPKGRPRHPLELVDAAIESLCSSDTWAAELLAGASDRERAELRAAAAEVVSKFLETWPPLASSWWPVTETALRLELGGSRIRLRGVVDLTLGQARGDRAGKVVIDLKTGGFSPSHPDDLRFYALLDTVRTGVPPRLIATYYLDAGLLHPEAVTVELLLAAVARTVDGITRLAALRTGAAPVERPSAACRWCPVRSGCEPGQAFLGAAAGEGLE